MAEAILAILGVALAVPGLAVTLAQYGDFVKDLTKKFINAPAAIREIGTFGRDLHKGKLKRNLQIAEAILGAIDVDDETKASIEDILNEFKTTLVVIIATLDGFLDKHGNVRRTRFVLYGERRSMRALEQLRNWQSEFENLIDLIERGKRWVPDPLPLTHENFRIIHKPGDQTYRQIEGSNAYLIDCEYKSKGSLPVDIKCVVETRPMLTEAVAVEVKAVATILASKLSHNASSAGMLECLGYRNGAAASELVFKLPPKTTSIRSLRSCFNSATRITSSPSERLRLCREICEAVLQVHKSGLVHKNIRSDTALMLQRSDTSINAGSSVIYTSQLGTIILSEWSMLRRATDVSSRTGTDDWMRDIYRHPTRQGVYPEARYHLGHDLYSLGVVLIEIGLWDTFVQPNCEPPISRLFIDTATGLGLVEASDTGSLEKLTAPLTVKSVMTDIAKTDLPSRLGHGVSDFVVACLTCLDGGMLGLSESAFREASTTDVLRIRELCLMTFS